MCTILAIAGESAGANYAMNLALILNDLRTEYKSKFKVSIQMVDGLFLIVTPMVIHTSICPSRSSSSWDVMG